MATQEFDFNKETNTQTQRIFLKDSSDIEIEVTEVQLVKVLQFLISSYYLQGRREPIELHSNRLPEAELQDIEVNTLLQTQNIHLENCQGVKLKVKEVQLEQVTELAKILLNIHEHKYKYSNVSSKRRWKK